MQQQMQLLLEPLQYTSVLQFADAALDAVAAGVGLKVVRSAHPEAGGKLSVRPVLMGGL
jgi:hypothetical protein